MNVVGFNSPEEMREYLRHCSERALSGLHVVQDRLTYGDTWVQFYDVRNRIIVFGLIDTLDKVREDEIDAGATPDEADLVVAQTKGSLEYGYMYGTAYSVLEPDGELGHTHKAHAWPIDLHTFIAAKVARWRIDDMPEGERLALEVAYQQMRAHVQQRGE